MRHAIYFMPRPDTALWRFGSSIIGYDAVTGAAPATPPHAIFAKTSIAAAMAEPRRYGFHATLKAPFRLGAERSEADLVAAVAEFSKARQPFAVAALKVATLGRFLALVPARPCAPLDTLAADCVRAFEPFRAPLDAHDRARRLAGSLTPRQIANLEAWGYPYVFDEFRFHMTLTGPLDEVEREHVRGALEELYDKIAAPLEIDAVAVAVQASREDRFRLLARCPFGVGP